MISARVTLSAFLVLAALPAAAQSPVSIQFQNGNVTLRASNVPLRTILAEWARVGGSEIVNYERVTGTVDSLTLENVPEREALRVLLRNISGYIVGAREVSAADKSAFGRIVLIPTPVTARAASAPPPIVQNQPPAPSIVYVPGDGQGNDEAGSQRTLQAQELLQRATQLQRQMREAAAAAAEARDAEEVEEIEEPEQPAPRRPATIGSPTPGMPGGVIRGSARPGEITPAPPGRGRTTPNDD